MLYEVITHVPLELIGLLKGKDVLYARTDIGEITGWAYSMPAGIVPFQRARKGTCVITSYSIHYTKLYDFLFFQNDTIDNFEVFRMVGISGIDINQIGIQ